MVRQSHLTNYWKARRKALAGSELAEVRPHVLRKTVGTLEVRSSGLAAASSQRRHSVGAGHVDALRGAAEGGAGRYCDTGRAVDTRPDQRFQRLELAPKPRRVRGTLRSSRSAT